MFELKAGFARVDVTPPLGTILGGYLRVRHAEGVLDPVMVTAVVFDDGAKRAAVFSVDAVGFDQVFMDRNRKIIAEAIGTVPEAVMIHCTHNHLGPALGKGRNGEYENFFVMKMRDAALLAAEDLAPAKLSYTRGKVKDVAFVRRFRMKDGSSRTNPGRLNPDIDHPMGTPDENSSLLIIKREGAPEIGIVHFQVHTDVINGNLLSADFPKFVRDTYETLIENSRCMYINGAQGDTNHVDVRLEDGRCCNGYERSKYMGRKIAMSVLADYELALPLNGDKVGYGQTNVMVKHNKGRADQIEEAVRISKLHREQGSKVAVPYATGMERVTIISEANRIVSLMDEPDEKELHMCAVSVGDVVFAGFPGEPFTEIGREVKANSKFPLTLPVSCANGYEGYYLTESAYAEGGYEARTVRYVAGTTTKLTQESIKLINSL